MSAPTMRRVVALIGTARPSPMPATAVLMPITLPRPAPAMTWAEVMRKPSGVMTTPEPAPSADRPPRVRRLTLRLATEGMSNSATLVTVREYASSASASLRWTALSPEAVPPPSRASMNRMEAMTKATTRGNSTLLSHGRVEFWSHTDHYSTRLRAAILLY